MSFKVIRDGSGAVLAFGPDDENYSPEVPIDCVLSTEQSAPKLTSNPQVLAAEQIRALEAKYLLPRAVREYLLADFADKAVKSGLDPMLLPAYVKLKTLDDQIKVLRAQL